MNENYLFFRSNRCNRLFWWCRCGWSGYGRRGSGRRLFNILRRFVVCWRCFTRINNSGRCVGVVGGRWLLRGLRFFDVARTFVRVVEHHGVVLFCGTVISRLFIIVVIACCCLIRSIVLHKNLKIKHNIKPFFLKKSKLYIICFCISFTESHHFLHSSFFSSFLNIINNNNYYYYFTKKNQIYTSLSANLASFFRSNSARFSWRRFSRRDSRATSPFDCTHKKIKNQSTQTIQLRC